MKTHFLATAIKVKPTPSLPGTHTLMNLVSGLDYLVIAAAVAGALISAGVLAVGNHSSNGRLADRGKSGLIASIAAAVVAGAVAALINFAVSTGGKIH